VADISSNKQQQRISELGGVVTCLKRMQFVITPTSWSSGSYTQSQQASGRRPTP